MLTFQISMARLRIIIDDFIMLACGKVVTGVHSDAMGNIAVLEFLRLVKNDSIAAKYWIHHKKTELLILWLQHYGNTTMSTEPKLEHNDWLLFQGMWSKGFFCNIFQSHAIFPFASLHNFLIP